MVHWFMDLIRATPGYVIGALSGPWLLLGFAVALGVVLEVRRYLRRRHGRRP